MIFYNIVHAAAKDWMFAECYVFLVIPFGSLLLLGLIASIERQDLNVEESSKIEDLI